ncbi:MAG: hypothetical protein HRT89_12525 [Lentisphaeria bacterium]|nr:hypothetical protein [Lentisphaeria bacterium]
MKILRLLALPVLLVSCSCTTKVVTDDSWLFKVNKKPLISLVYYPVPIDTKRRLAEPDLKTDSWTVTKMKLDIERFNELGIDVLKIKLDPFNKMGVNDAALKSFLKLLKEEKGFKIILSAECRSRDNISIRSFLDWSFSLNIYNHPAYMTCNNKPIVELVNVADPVLKLIGLYIDYKTWHVKHEYSSYPELKFTQLSNKKDEIKVVAALRGRYTWIKRNPASFQHCFQTLAQIGFKFIEIDSWNDYSKGSFIEPNTHDGRLFFDTLKRNVKQLKQK